MKVRYAICIATIALAIVQLAESAECLDNEPQSIVKAFGVTLGKSTISEVLFTLGTADAAFLAGADKDVYDPNPNDPVVLMYEESIELHHRYTCQIRVTFDNKKNLAESVSIMRNQGPENLCLITLQEIVDAFGSDYITTMHRLIEIDPVTSILSDCDDPDGDHIRLTYHEKGMSALFDKHKHLISMKFTNKILTGEEGRYIPCNS